MMSILKSCRGVRSETTKCNKTGDLSAHKHVSAVKRVLPRLTDMTNEFNTVSILKRMMLIMRSILS